MWSNHRNCTSLHFFDGCSTPKLFRISSFRSLSHLVTPFTNRDTLISAALIFPSNALVRGIFSMPYNTAGLITDLYSFPFNFIPIFMSQIIPVSFLHFCQPIYILLLITMWSANIMFHGALLRTLLIKWFINKANRQGLNAEPWWTPTSTG